MSQPNGQEVLCIGFGALGVMYSWILEKSGLKVTAITRPHMLDTMQSQGITIESEKFGTIKNWKPHRLVGDAAHANDRSYAYIVCSFKALPDLVPTASLVAPFIEGEHAQGKPPTIVLLQNGIGIEHPLQLTYPHVPIISVVAWIGANLLRERDAIRITHGKLERLVIGLYTGEGRSTTRGVAEDDFADPAGYIDDPDRKRAGLTSTDQFANALRAGGGTVEVAAEIQAARWLKALWNSALSSLCTLSRSTVSALLAPEVLPFTLPVTRRTMLEVLYVARAWGYSEEAVPMKAIDDTLRMTIQLYAPQPTKNLGTAPTSDVVNEKADSSRRATQNFKPSMLLDIEYGRPCELEPIIGSILDRARARGVATPRLDLVYATLKVQQDSALKSSSQRQENQEHINRWTHRKPPIAGAVDTHAWDRPAPKLGRFNSMDAGGDILSARPDKKLRGKPVDLDLA
ncbi:hypothetical protein MVLG_05983 [Microbotryum lychnidis-dioicae p1A1 Lamole]|uniref:2-dehydropantoate 2-reductase n=2 Tax=Microbotryum TaxID=34416 RepID=U5HFV7_USTV1|nr:hypothetical protein MVLG_05983 [Microbotryum lychnidis-dioicae p1A1 Lamole]SGY95405.1 BQ5605_C036g11491 [Microbotryum silenes-dioicae]|eukprot:KDE03555.1 hypothetical protein MVLG_05983 [Microbotryum lychnidis-dioicae p1A1 Lamole]